MSALLVILISTKPNEINGRLIAISRGNHAPSVTALFSSLPPFTDVAKTSAIRQITPMPAIAKFARSAKPIDERKRKPPTQPVKDAIELMVEEGLSWQDAAIQVGLTVRGMRKSLSNPLVLKVLRERKQMLREAVCAGNIRRLRQIRDTAPNMPAVKAIQMLEDGDHIERSSPSGNEARPGVTINIVSGLPAPLTIDATRDDERHHVPIPAFPADPEEIDQ